MRLRLFFAVLLVCGLVAGNGVLTAQAAPKRVYKGKTTQKRNIRIDVRKDSVHIKRFTAELLCRDGTWLILEEGGFLRTPVRGSRFRDRQLGRTDEVLIRGRVSRGVVRGRLRVRDRLNSGVRCDSRWFGFRARARGGR